MLPKPGIFQDHIQFLLVLTTPVDIAILGVSFTGDLCSYIHTYLYNDIKLLKEYCIVRSRQGPDTMSRHISNIIECECHVM